MNYLHAVSSAQLHQIYQWIATEISILMSVERDICVRTDVVCKTCTFAHFLLQ